MDMDVGEKPIPSYMKQARLDECHPLNARFRRLLQESGLSLPRLLKNQGLPKKQDLIYLINEHQTYKCTDLLDRVYALVPLSCDMQKLNIDYSAAPEVLLARVLSLTRDPPKGSFGHPCQKPEREHRRVF